MQDATRRKLQRWRDGRPMNLTPVERQEIRRDAARDPQVSAQLQELANRLKASG